jgi:hypothetical protein
MRLTKLNFNGFHWANLPKLAVVAFLLTACFPARSLAQQQGQKTFSSAPDASNALVAAAQGNDEKSAARYPRTGREANRLVRRRHRGRPEPR